MLFGDSFMRVVIFDVERGQLTDYKLVEPFNFSEPVVSQTADGFVDH